MPDYENYKAALKLGERSYREHLSRGEYPYLQILDEQLKHDSILSEVNLGLKEIPMDSIVGTYTAARRTAFAPNFMPLLSRYTEFAAKWADLCTAHLEEGIHDPIKVYEYMNRYYVQEGNKRVSVLKFFGARSVAGYVTRLIPQRSDLKENRVYFEFLDFYKVCPADYLVFSEPGSYKTLQQYAGKQENELWSEEEMKDLRSAYVRFDTAYKALGGEKLKNIKTGDALLTYLRFYDYHENIEKTPDNYKEDLMKIWDEIRLTDQEEPLRLVMDDAENRPGFLEKLLQGNNGRKLRIAFIYARTPAESSWTYGHELGRIHLMETFGDEIETAAYENVDLSTIDETLAKIIENGIDIIFATTPVFLGACPKAAVLHPEVKILDCAVNSAHRFIRTYYGRIYEAKFLSGLIAGALTENGEIGYLSDYPIYANIANLNAFALGVQAVNPNARVHIQWTAKAGSDPAAYFEENQVRIISGKELSAPSDPNREFGLYRLTAEGHENLAMTVWNWGILYQKLIESIQSGSFTELDKASGLRALNYWWGMDTDVIDLFLSKNVPEATLRLVEFMKAAIRDGSFSPFSGILRSTEGPVTTDESAALTPAEIMTMHWLNENIIGTLPTPEELTPDGRAIMAVQGSEEG